MRRLPILLLLMAAATPLFATGQCGNDPAKPDPQPFACNAPLTAKPTAPVALPPPPVLVSVAMSKLRVVAGNSDQGTVTIDRAVNYDLIVSLTIDPPSIATLPAHVTITHGSTAAVFPVSATLTDFPAAVVGTIYANFNTTKTVSLNVLPANPPVCDGTNAEWCTDVICYKCFFAEPGLPQNFVEKTQDYLTTDPLVKADRDFIVWRATSKPNCEALENYRKDLATETDPDRKLQAYAVLGFTGTECDKKVEGDFKNAALQATQTKRDAEAKALRSLSIGTFKPVFGDVKIVTSLSPVNGSTTMILGDSTIELQNTRIGSQVERVFRDWVSFKLDWSAEIKPAKAGTLIPWGEGQAVTEIMKIANVQVFPLSGTLIARRAGQWYGPDENGVFRFNVLADKVQYPTTHVDGNVGWIIDTHGTSALVSQALEYKMQTVIACGDSIGKAKAAYYLAQHGVNVINMADRYEYLLLGYQGKGTIIGNAPVHIVEGKPVVGHQPIAFSLTEPFVVEDTKMDYPVQYYDAPAKYFHRLSSMVPLSVFYEEVTAANQLDKIFDTALHVGSTAIGVRIATQDEDAALRKWLRVDPKRRAILFHSGLYPYAPGLFSDFPTQVTFGDMHPRFEQ